MNELMNNEFILSDYFPVEELSFECYKERKAGSSQTLTGLGKWWGRKPLILVRAIILGTLMPISKDEEKDKEIFLKILTMDKKGLELRKRKKCENFDSLPYEKKLKYCCRPEEVELTDVNEWKIINNHLKTNANSLQSLIEELGKRKFGHIPIVGDCFAGGGSIPFEAARMGCKVYASDLNPVACLLNWANLNILSKSDEEIEKLREFQQNVYNEVDKQIQEWGIETNEEGHRANSYLYCSEAECPKCGYTVPLAPSWIIGKDTKTIAILKDNGKNRFDIDIKSGVTNEEIKLVESMPTINKGKMICPHCNYETPISVIKKDRVDEFGSKIYGIRKWKKDEFISKEDDVFIERLYCIRYIKKVVDEKEKCKEERYYTKPTDKDILREEKVIKLLKEKFSEYQEKGYIPSLRIESGYNTDQPIRERGWVYWHQLFNQRQLLTMGLFQEKIQQLAMNKDEYVIGLLGINRCINNNSKLSKWHPLRECIDTVFINQSLNTLFNYGCKSLLSLYSNLVFDLKKCNFINKSRIMLADARNIDAFCDLWITDPPYADAVNYHELSEFFLAWDKNIIEEKFKEWYTDSKRILAVKGKGQGFNQSMIDVYSNLAKNMTDNGIQVIMFAHSDNKVWNDLLKVLEESNLKLIKKIDIRTETESGGLQKGENRQRNTSLLICKKNK